jgi:hypothetical protein
MRGNGASRCAAPDFAIALKRDRFIRATGSSYTSIVTGCSTKVLNAASSSAPSAPSTTR